MTDQHAATDQWGYNLVGYLSGNIGLSVAARNTLHALECRHERVERLDVDAGRGRMEESEHAGSHLTRGLAVNLFHVNPDEVRTVSAANWAALDPLHRLNVIVPFWELPHLPARGWRDVLGAMDVVLAPSLFVMDAITEALPAARVLHYPQAVFLPDDVCPDRAGFGLPDDAMVFYTSLDLTSDPERKNPSAALRAFAQAFGDAENVALAIRLNNPGYSKATREAHELLTGIFGDDPRVFLFDHRMDYRTVLSLSASSDAFVSLHRSEGLGLNIMEAMSLGKPVITTGWSGNMDFTTTENAMLVDYDLIPVKATHASYAEKVIGPEQVWADASVESAAKCMRELYEYRGMAQTLGMRARADMESRRRDFERGTVFDDLRAAYAESAPLGGDGGRASALRAALSDPLSRRARRAIAGMLRGLGLR